MHDRTVTRHVYVESLSGLLLPPCIGKYCTCNNGWGQCFCGMGSSWMPLFEQVWLFIVCYYRQHCFLAQSRDDRDSHCSFLFFFLHSLEK